MSLRPRLPLTVGMLFALAGTCEFLCAAELPNPVDRKIDFMRDVDPILVQHCYACHGDDAAMNGYSLWRRKSAARGGYSGQPGFIAGDSAKQPPDSFGCGPRREPDHAASGAVL